MPKRPRAATIRRLQRSTSPMATAALGRMDATFPWYRAMPPENRSWIGLVLQAGIAAFTEWFRNPDSGRGAVTADVFGTAPRELTRAVTLQQTVDMVRVAISVVEERVDELAAPGDEDLLREGVLRYSREIAFAAAQVYARAAEARGAWDARLEALVVDGLLRGETDDALRSRAAALGWQTSEPVVVIAGTAPEEDPEAVVESLRRLSHAARLDILTGVHGDRLIVVCGGTDDPLAAGRRLVARFGPGPVVVGPAVGDLVLAGRSAKAALAGLAVAEAWTAAPRPVLADDLLPERALDGDADGRRQLVDEVYRPIAEGGTALLETLDTYLGAVSLEAAARAMFVHPNTMRYRLRRITDLTGLSPTMPRDAFTLRVALALGRITDTGEGR